MIIVKIGGGKSINIEGIVEDLSSLKDQMIIVHGANAARDEVAEKIGYEIKRIVSIKGYESVYSDSGLIDLQMMVYAGLINKRIVECCLKNRIMAVGLSGVDGGLIKGKRNRGIRVRENGKTRILRDFSGKPIAVNTQLIKHLLDGGYTPVLTVPIVDEDNNAINSENDDIVAILNRHLSANMILQFIEEEGLMTPDNGNGKSKLLRMLNRDELKELENRLSGRIKRKIHALNELIEYTGTKVMIGDGRTQHPVLEVFSGKGTIIK